MRNSSDTAKRHDVCTVKGSGWIARGVRGRRIVTRRRKRRRKREKLDIFWFTLSLSLSLIGSGSGSGRRKMRSAMAASSSCCLAWPGGAPPMAFSSSPPPLLLSVAAPHRLPSEPLLPCLRLCPRPCPRPHSPARKALKQEKTVNTDVEAGQGEMEDKAAKEAVPMDGNGNRSSLSDPEAPPLAETLEASSAETLVGSAKTLEADSEALVGSAKALVVDSKTLVNPSETLEAACKTLEVATETLQGASEALVADSETLEVASKTLQGASETLLADSETLEAASGTLVADPKSLAVGTASAPNAASEPARNGKPRMVASPVKDWSQTASLSMNGEKFRDARWKYGTWDLEMFKKDGETAWDDVIDAEVLRRKWLQDRPESTNNDEPVVFESSVIPWWAWVKRFHLPEAELLNGRAAMIGFFMAYVVDSLTGVGLVDQMSSFFGKLLLFIAVVGVMVIRKNEDVKTITEFVKEWSFYDKQWQATWREDPPSSEKNKKDL